MRLIDTHCHINFPENFPDPCQVIEESKAAGVDRLLAVGCDEKSSLSAIELSEQFEGVYAVVGWHPTYVGKFDLDSIPKLRKWLEHPKVVAMGEIGLDFHWDFTTPELQYVALGAQLDLALELESPVVFHCREAYPELLEVLESRPMGKYLFHCFSGGASDAARARALGAFLGVDGPLTYKNAQSLRDIVADWPKDRVVLETDSPYLPPEPHRGKPNRPAWTTFVNLRLASIWGVGPEESAAITTANAEAFFGI